jgi:hypothetical protein
MRRKEGAFAQHKWSADPVIIDQQLLQASKLVEDVAYALAGDVSTERVTRLMLISADIDRLACALRGGAANSGGPCP